MKIKLLLSLLLAASCVLRAAEPVVPPAPPTPPPVPALPEFDRKAFHEFEAKGAAEQALRDNPKSIIGSPPAFPVQDTSFEVIQDDDDNLRDNFNFKKGEMEMDLLPMEAVLKALRASTQEHLEANVSDSSTYKKLWMEPARHRGQVVRIQGVLHAVTEIPCPSCSEGVKSFWRGEISNGEGNITTFRMLEPLPAGLTKGQPVEIVGIFLQRFAFYNEQPGGKVTWAPLIFARTIKRYSRIDVAIAANNPMNSPGAIAVFCILSIGAVLYCYSRSKLRTGMPNKFSRLKAEKNGPSGNFPAPRSAKKHFPQPPKKPPENV
jgi:hypothetical protein